MMLLLEHREQLFRLEKARTTILGLPDGAI
jgi:hypothetical protein